MVYTDLGFKKFPSKRDRLATEMNKCIQKTETAEWMTKENTTLIKKKPSKEVPQPTINP